MAKSLSLSELTALYANKGKNPKALFEYDPGSALASILPGVSTLDKLNKLYFTRQNGLLPLRPKTWPKESEQSMIAICLVIVDTLHHEDIWRAWCEKGSEGKHYQARLFIHAKYPEKIKSAWVKSNLIDVTFRPEWNSVEVVQALLSTLDTALQYIDNNSRKDGATDATKEVTGVPKCGRFLFGTETCLPLYDLQYIGETLFAENCSWLNAYHTPVGTWEAGACFRAVDAEVVPPQAVWKSLPGWIVLTRRHAAEILALVNLLGGWRERQRQRESAKDEYFGSYKGTPAECWREKGDIDTDSSTTTATTSPAEVPTAGTVPVTDIAVPAKEGDRQKEEENEVRMQDSGQMVVLAHESIVGACQVADLTPVGESPHTQAQQQLHPQPAAPELSPVPAVPTTEQKLEQKQCPTALLSAWGRGGTWHERNSSVFAPEEVFFPTMLSLLGYLRADHVSSTANSSANSGVMTTPSGEVKIAAVTFAEWAKRGDANPIQYAHCDANLVKRMRRSGALFGRKFAPGSASWSQWQDVMNQLSDGEGLANNGRKTSGAYSDGGRNDYGDVYGDGRRIEQHDRDIIRFNSTNNYSSYDNHHSTSSTYYGGSGYSSHNYSRQYNSQSTYNREGGSRGEGYDGGREGSYPGGDYNRHGKEEHPGDRRNAPYDPRWQGNREHDSAKRRRY